MEEHRLKVSENRVLRRIFGPKRVQVTGSWSKLYNEELHNVFSSDISVIKSRRMRFTRHVACMGRLRNAYTTSVAKPRGREHFEVLSVGVRMILNRVRIGFIWLRVGCSGRLL
jgi:hypothetical protein